MQQMVSDKRQFDFESYFVKGLWFVLVIGRNFDEVRASEACVGVLFGSLAFVHQVHPRDGVQQFLRCADRLIVSLQICLDFLELIRNVYVYFLHSLPFYLFFS